MAFIHLKEGDLQDTQKCGRGFKKRNICSWTVWHWYHFSLHL